MPKTFEPRKYQIKLDLWVLQKNCGCYDFIASMKGSIDQLNLIPNRIPTVLIRPRRNHHCEVAMNAFIPARGRHVLQSLVQNEGIFRTQQWIQRILPKTIFLVLIVHQQIEMCRIVFAKRKQGIRIFKSDIAICIWKYHLNLHKTVVSKTAIKRVNPF